LQRVEIAIFNILKLLLSKDSINTEFTHNGSDPMLSTN
jgi:hypothetical protein